MTPRVLAEIYVCMRSEPYPRRAEETLHDFRQGISIRRFLACQFRASLFFRHLQLRGNASKLLQRELQAVHDFGRDLVRWG